MRGFLDVPASAWLADNELAFAIRDAAPVSPGHSLIIPKRSVPTWWDATPDEHAAIIDLLGRVRRRLDVEHQPAGYNVGFNAGATAGQTVDHLHLHVIPRYPGDVPDPRGGIRHVIPSLGNPTLPGGPRPLGPPVLVTPAEGRMRLELVRCLLREDLDRIDLLVSFLMRSGVDIVAGRIDEALARGAHVRVLTTDYLQITDDAALGFFLDRVGARPGGGRLEVRVFSDPTTSFHPKAYLFSSSQTGTGIALVGSSNLSRSALEVGVEWNIQTEHLGPLRDEFRRLWDDDRSRPLTRGWLDRYSAERSRRLQDAQPLDEAAAGAEPEPPPRPIGVQDEALAALTATRIEGSSTGLVVLATGLGKTWLAAFDSTRPEFRRVLFIAHREEILLQARDVYRRIMPARRFSLFTGADRDLGGNVVFASVQSLHRNLAQVPPDAFDYVVVDEFHHADAPTYRKVIGHLRPRFLLGLTATPDRSDAADLLALCADNLVFDCGLVEGVQRGLLSDFSYRAIRDVADYADIPWRSRRFDAAMLTEQLETEQRAAQVHDEWMALGGERRKTIGFCCSITHAEFMAEFFRARGVDALAVHSGPASAPRAETLERFRAGQVPVVFSVDLFNEGVDVPDLDVVLLLRPTESPVVFFQQLGRGLRRAPGKDRLDVVDLVGNHRSFLLKAHLLAGLGGVRPGSNRAAVDALRDGPAGLPDGCSIVVDTDVIDLLAQLAGPERAQDRLRAQIDAWRAVHEDRRPTALELALFTGQAHDLKRFGGWFGALSELGELDDEEAAAASAAADLLTYVEHGSYTKSFKLVTMKALVDADALRQGMPLAEVALAARWLIDRDPRLRHDLIDAGFAVPSRPTSAEWSAYWSRNPIKALTNRGRGQEAAWFAIDDGRLHLEADIPDGSWSTVTDLVEEVVEYRLHRYLAARSTRRAGETRKPLDATGVEVDATFVVEGEADAPVAVFYESAGGAAGSSAARNTQYVDGLDLLLQRMRDLRLVVEDAYVDSTRTSDLPVPARRLSPGDGVHYPVDLAAVDDLIGLRKAILRSMAKVGRAPGVTGGGNSRKAMRLVVSGVVGTSARDLADVLSGLPPIDVEDALTS